MKDYKNFDDLIKNKFQKLYTNIKMQPKHCEICGKTENLKDVFLKYDCGMWLCDDCAIEYYKTENEVKEEEKEILTGIGKEFCKSCRKRYNKIHSGTNCPFLSIDNEFCPELKALLNKEYKNMIEYRKLIFKKIKDGQ